MLTVFQYMITKACMHRRTASKQNASNPASKNLYQITFPHPHQSFNKSVIELSLPPLPPISVNEYQLRLGRQRQVWFIPLPDVRGVCR